MIDEMIKLRKKKADDDLGFLSLGQLEDEEPKRKGLSEKAKTAIVLMLKKSAAKRKANA